LVCKRITIVVLNYFVSRRRSDPGGIDCNGESQGKLWNFLKEVEEKEETKKTTSFDE